MSDTIVQPKYSKGQEVRYVKDGEFEPARTVVSRQWDDEANEWGYKLSSVEVNLQRKSLDEGFIFVRENEVQLLQNESNEQK